jgi:hypothetical protein
MSQAEKKLQKMRNNQRDWIIEDVASVASRHGIEGTMAEVIMCFHIR